MTTLISEYATVVLLQAHGLFGVLTLGIHVLKQKMNVMRGELRICLQMRQVARNVLDKVFAAFASS